MVCSRASFTFTFTVNNLVREIVVMVGKSREISAVFITSPDAVSRQGDDLSLVQTDEYKETLTAVFCKTLTAVFYKTLTAVFCKTLTAVFCKTLTHMSHHYIP
jgi:hypothetical protein